MMYQLLFMLIVLPAFSLQQCLTPDDSKITTDPNARLALYKGEQQFALSLLQTINGLMPAENIFFSPFSVYNAMLLAYFSASNHTEAALKKALFIPEPQDKLSTMQAYRLEKYFQKMRAYNGSASYELSSANRLFVSPQQSVRECMKLLFDDEITVTDFAKDPAAATEQINKWVAEQTKNQIKDLLHEGQLTTVTQLLLANAAYFKGLWKNKFQPESTRKEVFYISGSQNAFVTMMRQKSTFNHLVSEKLGAHILELPYKGEDVSMYILLPPFASPNGITNILKRLTLDKFQEVASEGFMVPRAVDVSVPKFTIEKELEMTPILESLGVGDVFKPTSDLSGLTGKPGLSLDECVHKAKIMVDEDGTTAAAATAVFNFRSSRPLDPARFICNHPFVYLIFDKVSQTILFTGIFNKPPQQATTKQ
uniref:Putative serine proteinase inhibitor n=1 Tax=Panstrongylus lignarius TaxID=156445 RepID=A0A224XD42_9HEMI